MKYTTYFITFFAYASLHILRMGYSGVKPYFQQTYQLNSVILGLFDGLIYIFVGIGYFLRFWLQGNLRKTTMYCIFSTLTAISFSVIPLIAIIFQDESGVITNQSIAIRQLIPGVSLIIFGFCQFSSWPILLYLVNQHFDVSKDGLILGLWSSTSNVGNILGFFLSELILNILEVKWQYVMLIGAFLHAVMGFVVLVVLKDQRQIKRQQLLQSLKKEDNQQRNDQQKKSRGQNFKIFIRYCKQIMASKENNLYLLSMALLKSILYGFLLWMPTYFTHQGYKQYSIYAPILFNLSTIIGSGILGYFYKSKPRVPRDQYLEMSMCQQLTVKINKVFKSYSLFSSCLFVCATLLLFFEFQFNIITSFVFSFIAGFFLGGAFNMLASNEVMEITKGEQEKVDMLSTLSMGIGNFVVGLVQIIIGFSLDVKDDSNGQKNLFVVLLVISGLVSLIILYRSALIYKKRRQQSFILQEQIDAVKAANEHNNDNVDNSSGNI